MSGELNVVGMALGFVVVGDSCRGEDGVLKGLCIGIFGSADLGIWDQAVFCFVY